MARKRTKSEMKRPAAPKTPVRGSGAMDFVERHGAWFAAGAMALMLVLFFHQVFFEGKTFQPPDQAASVAHRSFIEDSFASEGSFLDRYPLWTPYIFSGMPTLGSLTAAPYTNPMSLVLTPVPGVFKVITYYLLLGFFTWLFLRRRGLGTLVALFGAASYVFCAHVITMIMFGHNSKIATLVFLPLVLLATDEIWRRPGLKWISILGLALGTMLVTSHFQISYYTLLAAGLFLLVSTVFSLKGGMKPSAAAVRWGAWLAGLALGLAASAVLFLPVREYAAHSIRGGGAGGGLDYGYATNWSLHPLEMATFFVPSFMGFGGESYWGWMPFTDFPHYMGILPLLLAVLAVALWPRERLHLTFLLLALLSLLLAFGKHLPLLYNLMFAAFPYFNKFRVPSMILVLFQFAVAMLAALGLARILRAPAEDRPRILKRLWIVAAVFGGLVAVLGGAVAGGAIEGTVARRLGERASIYGAVPEQMMQFVPRVTEMVGGDLVAVLFVLAAGSLLLWGGLRNRIPGWVVPAGILVLTLFDLWRVDARAPHYYPRSSRDASFEPTDAVKFLEQDPGRFRILPLTGQGLNNNQFAYFRISSILGYHPAKLQIYQNLISDGDQSRILKSLVYGNTNLVSMLNMKYVVADGPGFQRYQELFRVLVQRGFREVHRSAESIVLENPDVLPRMWFVDRVRVMDDPGAALAAVSDSSWRPAEEAVVLEDPGPVDPAGGARAEITRYEPREIDAELESPGTCFLVVSEVYYDAGWHAWLDGEPVEILRTDYALRGLVVPPGRHELKMRFDPGAFRRGALLSIGAYAAILIGLAVSVVGDRRRRTRSASS